MIPFGLVLFESNFKYLATQLELLHCIGSFSLTIALSVFDLEGHFDRVTIQLPALNLKSNCIV